MTSRPLRGVIAAVPTPLRPGMLQPDPERFTKLCRQVLDAGCDGLNLCGTTGEAASFSVEQRMALMSAAAARLPLDRCIVGTGAASVADALALTRRAADLGFAGALLLPPFYYPGIDVAGLLRFFAPIVEATAATPIPLYLYNVPADSKVAYTREFVRALRERFGPERIAGLKDASGVTTLAIELAQAWPDFDVFPSDEACLPDARAGRFAGCISASAAVSAPYCRKAWMDGDAAALDTANRLRAVVSRRGLIAGVRAVCAELFGDASYAEPMPPLLPLPPQERQALMAEYRAVQAGR